MERVGTSRLQSIGNYFYSCFDAVAQRINEHATAFFSSFEDAPLLVDVEKTPDRAFLEHSRLERDLNLWDLEKKIVPPFFNLSTRKSLEVSWVDDREPKLFVKLPRRQLHVFPVAMKRNLLNIEEDRLDVFFAIYVLDGGKKDFNLSFPQWKNGCSLGFYGGTGVARGPGKTVPWHFIREYSERDVREGLTARLTGDIGAFKMGAFAQNCKGPSRGTAVYGLVLSDEGRGKAVRELLNHSYSIQEFVDRVGSDELTQIFTFNDNY